jgi:hypothetical protein
MIETYVIEVINDKEHASLFISADIIDKLNDLHARVDYMQIWLNH